MNAPANGHPVGWFRLRLFGVAAFGSLLIPGILNAGVVPQELAGIQAEFELSHHGFGILAGSIAVVAMLLGVTAAWAIPRFGAYVVCLAGYLIFMIGMVGVAWAPFGIGAAGMGVMVAWGMAYLHQGNGLVVKLAPHRAASMTNLLHGINALGKAIGPTFALIGTGWRAPFLALASLAGLLGVAGLFGRAPAKRDDAKQDEPEERPAKEALCDRLFWACAVVFFPILGMELVVVLWLPNYLKQEAGLDEPVAKVAAVASASVMLWTMCIGRFLAPVLLRRIPSIVYLTVCTSCALGLLMGTEFGWWTDGRGVLTMVLFGVGCSAPWPTFFAIACRHFPGHRGLLSVVSGVSSTLAWIVFSIVGGVLGTKVGLIWTLRLSPVLALIIIVGGWCVHVAGERRIKADGVSPD